MDAGHWWALDDAAARRCAASIAEDLGVRLVDVRWHEFAGRRGQVALFDVDGAQFAFVPGGQTSVGYDGDRFVPTTAQHRSFSEGSDQLRVADDIHAFVDAMTSPPRSAVLPSLLVSVAAVDVAAVPVPVDDPVAVDYVGYVRATTANLGDPQPRRVKSAGRVAAILGDDWTIERAWLIQTPTHAQIVERLARRGQRLLTADEWEQACGAGACTLFRWGDVEPDGRPHELEVGPHREANLFGLQIGQNPYDDEWTAEPAVVRGGDGGRMAHSGLGGRFVDWLTLATAYRDPYYEQWLHADRGQLDRVMVRPAIPVP